MLLVWKKALIFTLLNMLGILLIYEHKAKNQEQSIGKTKGVKMDPACEDVNTMAGNLLLTCSHVLSC